MRMISGAVVRVSKYSALSYVNFTTAGSNFLAYSKFWMIGIGY